MYARSTCMIIAALACANAGAFCLPVPHYRYVGDVASDSQCTDNDIQSAIDNATCPNTTIVITREHTYTTQALEINGKSLTLVGVGDGVQCNQAPTSCDPDLGCGGGSGAPPAPNVTLHGNGAASVLYIHGSSNVTLESLELTGGGGTAYGGGVHFSGSGSLTLIDSTIVDNAATYGGGIQFNGSGGAATLTLGAGTIIDVNSAANDGGGIQVNGSARLFALAPWTFIGYNQAGGQGGGVAVVGPARADIASPGYNGGAVIQFNSAAYGGGIAIDGNDSSESTAEVRLFSVDAAHPVQVSGNTASHTGGGVYLHPNLGGIGFADLCAYDFRIDDNIAQEGTAIYSDLDSDFAGSQIAGDVLLNSDPYGSCTAPETTAALGGVACAAGVPCNTIDGNVAQDDANTPKPGSTILIQNNGSLEADRLVMRGNRGAHAIRVIDPQVAQDNVSNCLLVENTLTAQVVLAQTGDDVSALNVRDCTIANDAASGAVVRAEFAFSLKDSIVDVPGVATLDYTGAAADLDVSYVLSNDASTLPVAPGVAQGEPQFVDAAGHDYHLRWTSLGVDYAPGAGGADLDRAPRDVDLASVPNGYGPRDIGAYERQFACAADAIFCNGFDVPQ